MRRARVVVAVVIADDVYRACAAFVEAEPAGSVPIRGLAGDVPIWKLRALRSDAAADHPLIGREVEVAADGKLLVLENVDQPGMVGTIGTILGKANVNIADMSLSRLTPGGTAYMVVRGIEAAAASIRERGLIPGGHAEVSADTRYDVCRDLCGRETGVDNLQFQPFGYYFSQPHTIVRRG